MLETQSTLYPEIEPYREGKLAVSKVHTLHFEECGNPDGKPALFLHGGPGSGMSSARRRLFNPESYRIIMYDQRGCGLSSPNGSLQDNTTQDLVEDTEKLRLHLNIDKWLVAGGSWGSTLALAYAQAFPQHVSNIILYGIFLGTKYELDWSFQSGANFILADAWEKFSSFIPNKEHCDLMKAYWERINATDIQAQLAASKAWLEWEGSGIRLIPEPVDDNFVINVEETITKARIECHYFLNNCFLADNQIINNIDSVRHIPGVIVQGRYDLVCPFKSAWQLHKSWPEAEFIVVPDAGHTAREPGTQKALVEAINKFSK